MGLYEYNTMHTKILENFYPALNGISAELTKFSSIPQCLILFTYSYMMVGYGKGDYTNESRGISDLDVILPVLI